jgi:hypothetical protein
MQRYLENLVSTFKLYKDLIDDFYVAHLSMSGCGDSESIATTIHNSHTSLILTGLSVSWE